MKGKKLSRKEMKKEKANGPAQQTVAGREKRIKFGWAEPTAARRAEGCAATLLHAAKGGV